MTVGFIAGEAAFHHTVRGHDNVTLWEVVADVIDWVGSQREAGADGGGVLRDCNRGRGRTYDGDKLGGEG